MTTKDWLSIIFLALLHTYVWYGWAKADFYAAKNGASILSLKRIIIMVIPLLITIMSILVVPYPYPSNPFIRVSIDIIAVGVIIGLRIWMKHNDKKRPL